jgi:hypothetical protein
MSETIGTILVDEGKITLKPFEDKEETWEESKSLINTVGTKFILFEGKKYYQENNKTHQ